MEKDIKKDNHIKVIQDRFNNIAAALYLVTNHLSDDEPLKTNIRDTIHIVLEEFLEVSDISGTFLDSRLGHIRNLLRIATIANLVSSQNVVLLDNEISIVQNNIRDMYKQNSNIAIDISEILFLKTDSLNESNQTSFQNPKELSGLSAETNMQNVYGAEFTARAQGSISQNSQKTKTNMLTSNIGQNNNQKITLNQIQKPILTNQGNDRPVYNSIPKKESISQRQALIIKEIRSKDHLTIRDLIGKIEGCSEKTIQRELLSLVETGILKKEGERRWSRYSIQ